MPPTNSWKKTRASPSGKPLEVPIESSNDPMKQAALCHPIFPGNQEQEQPIQAWSMKILLLIGRNRSQWVCSTPLCSAPLGYSYFPT